MGLEHSFPPVITEDEWEEKHKGHLTEEWTPDPTCERRSLICYDCDEEISWPTKTWLDLNSEKSS